MSKPKFYQAKLVEIKGNVLEKVYPYLFNNPNRYGKIPMTMTERMGTEEAICPECGKNEWWLLPDKSVTVTQGGKPYIECLHCGYQTHL